MSGAGRTMPPLDPRTVSPAVLFQSLAGRRPGLALASLSGGACTLTLWDEASRTRISTVAHPRRARESDPAMLSRLLPVCVARLLVIDAVGHEDVDLAAVTAAFDAAPLLGATTDGGRRFCFRGEIWTSLGGCDGQMPTLAEASRDLFAKIAALGFAVPGVPARDVEQLLGREDAVYTAITNRYDTLKPQPRDFAGQARQLAFLDRSTADFHGQRSRGWEVVAGEVPDTDPRRASRYWKANAHLALPQSGISLWVDASISIAAPMSLARLAGLFLAEHDICVFSHHARRSIAAEAQACKALQLDDPDVIYAQLARYATEGYPDEDLAELPVILRRHTPAIEALNESWWSEITRGSHRDQISFNYVAWKTGVQYERFPLSLAVRNGLFVKMQRVRANRETSIWQ